MGADRGYVAQNNTARPRLSALVAGVSDAHLEHPMPASWAVADVLAYLAFRDQGILTLLEQWERREPLPSPKR